MNEDIMYEMPHRLQRELRPELTEVKALLTKFGAINSSSLPGYIRGAFSLKDLIESVESEKHEDMDERDLIKMFAMTPEELTREVSSRRSEIGDILFDEIMNGIRDEEYLKELKLGGGGGLLRLMFRRIDAVLVRAAEKIGIKPSLSYDDGYEYLFGIRITDVYVETEASKKLRAEHGLEAYTTHWQMYGEEN